QQRICTLKNRHREQAPSHIWNAALQLNSDRLSGRHREQTRSHRKVHQLLSWLLILLLISGAP
ncbi:hypothetical protein QN409_25760, partial [Pseudomonas sp. MH9.3]|uniref:hypothetical protein n=1 Tax=Pseudomonas sp. MH9.3 TaxID=3048630 RepID=UPI002B222BF8